MNKQPVSYLQTDSRWKAKAWNGMAIGDAGCGPTSAAMLISTLTGEEITPDITYAWAGNHCHLEKGHGTLYGNYFQSQFAAYGLKCQMLNWQNSYGNPSHANHQKVVDKLKEGYYAIALMGPGNWTTGGHFVVLWWVDGKCRINDPASTRTDRNNGDIQTFRSQVKYYWLVDARAYNNEEDDDMNVNKLTNEEAATIVSKLTDEQAYHLFERAMSHAATLGVPAWATKEYAEAVEAGITDGTRPMAPVTRLEAGLMAKRAAK